MSSEISNRFSLCSTNEDKKKQTSYYAWTARPLQSSKFKASEIASLCVIKNVQSMVYFIESNVQKGQHIHGIAYMGYKNNAAKATLEQTENQLNNDHPNIQFKLARCWDPEGWSQYIQKDGGFENTYPINHNPKWWSKFRTNTPNNKDIQQNLKEIKKENGKDFILFTTLKEHFDSHGFLIDLGSMMCYTKSEIKGVYKEVIDANNNHCSAFKIIGSIISKNNLVSISKRDSIISSILSSLDGSTFDDILKATFGIETNSETSISDVMQKYCINLQHLCIRFKDFAIEAPYNKLITGKDLNNIHTVHYFNEITLENREEEADVYRDSEAPILEILKLNNQLNLEVLSTIFEAMGKRLGPKHRAIHNSGVSNGAKTTVCEYPKSYLPRKAYAILNKELENEFSLSPYIGFLKLFVEEGEKFLSKGGPVTKILLEGGDIDVPLKGKNESKELHNEHVMWINSNLKKDSDEWLYDTAKMNRLFNIVYTHSFDSSNSKSNEDVIEEIHKNKYQAMNFLFEANKLFKENNSHKWKDLPLNDTPQDKKRDKLIEMYRSWYINKENNY